MIELQLPIEWFINHAACIFKIAPFHRTKQSPALFLNFVNQIEQEVWIIKLPFYSRVYPTSRSTSC